MSIIAIAVLSLVLGVSLSVDFLAKPINFGALTSFIILNISVFWLSFIRDNQRAGFKNILTNLILPLPDTLILCYFWIKFAKDRLKIGFI